MEILQALALGIIQGLTEFLPVSSSAHLSLVPWMFGWKDPGLAFDVALHVGTLVAVLWYFRVEWRALAVAAISIVTTRHVDTPDKRRVVELIIATIPGGIAGLVLGKYAEGVFRTPALTASALIVMGTLLWLVDRRAAQKRPLAALGYKDALLMGCAQAFAIIPGVSRSGATITAGRGLAIDRHSAAVFSFMMSMPIIAAAATRELPHALRESGLSLPLVVGMIAAALSSWVAIAILLRYVTRHSYGIFAVYRWALGLLVFALVAWRG